MYVYQFTQSRPMAIVARRLAYLPSCALVVLTLRHRIWPRAFARPADWRS